MIIFITSNIQTIDLIFIIILTIFQLICPSVSCQTQEPTQPQTEPFIQSTMGDCSNSVNYDQVQVLSYCKYSLLFFTCSCAMYPCQTWRSR